MSFFMSLRQFCRTSNVFRHLIFILCFNCILFYDYCILINICTATCIHGCAWQLLIKKYEMMRWRWEETENQIGTGEGEEIDGLLQQPSRNRPILLFIYSFIHFLMVQQLRQSRAMTTSQNRDTMSKPGSLATTVTMTVSLKSMTVVSNVK